MKVTGKMGETLVELASQFQDNDMILLVGGGYGIELRAQWVNTEGLSTRFDELYPPRSSDDIDVFLSLELLVDSEKNKLVRNILETMNYVPRPGAENFHFVHEQEREEDRGLYPKIDLLAENPEKDSRVEINSPRVRAKNAPDTIHGRLTPEAIAIDQEPTKIKVETNEVQSVVYLPHPLLYGILKLYAIRDSIENSDREREYSQYHAFDLFMILGMMTERDWQSREHIADSIQDHDRFEEAQAIIQEYFDLMSSAGMVRLREFIQQHRPAIPERRTEEFMNDLFDLYEITC